ncbi:MAG: hypothetical protein ABUL57_00950, partial [Chloroflexota bacterium]
MIAVSAITFDFGNTLVPVDRSWSRGTIVATADALTRTGMIRDEAAFIAAWAEERDRQFREEVPLFREVDVPQRAIRVLARLRGMPAPPPEARWDDEAAATYATPDEAEHIVDAYSRAFVARAVAVDDAFGTLELLA